MSTVAVVALDPEVEIILQFLERSVDLLAKHHPESSIEHRLVKTLSNDVGMRAFSLS
jgi:hypothetical protein